MDGMNPLMNIDPATLMAQSTQEECQECGGILFRQVMAFRRVSKVLVQGNKDQLVPIPVFVCNDCNTPIGDMIPKELEDNPKKEGTGKIVRLDGN